jgi:hypothetical protein
MRSGSSWLLSHTTSGVLVTGCGDLVRGQRQDRQSLEEPNKSLPADGAQRRAAAEGKRSAEMRPGSDSRSDIKSATIW